MNSALGVAWQQLSHQRVKLVAAAAGVVVAVMLMLVQLGIRTGAMESSVSFSRRINSDLVVVSPRTKSIFRSAQFPRRLLYRLPSDRDVQTVSEVYISLAQWKNKWESIEHPISVYGIDPSRAMLELPGFSHQATTLQLADHLIFDSLSRTNYGPVNDALRRQGTLETEVNGRRVKVFDSIAVGISINTDGNLYCSPTNFLRLFPDRPPGSIDLGLVKLAAGADADAVAKRLQPLLGAEARIVTRQALVDAEIAYVRETAPIDFIFGMGALVGFFIGFVVVYQILYTEVANHLPQLATMKAMGFTDGYLLRLVLWQALILAALGYLPGFALAIGLYEVAEKQIQMQFSMTWERALGVWIATLSMCAISALIAVRKAWAADPADVF
ncbi:MAG: ABC transporter permease DevC [Pirellulaceae bacterium]|nr:ABC transporter permease DevC [Pirellulaceae bacterium]